MNRSLEFPVESFAFRKPFRIAGHVFEATNVVVAELGDGQHWRRGEAAGAYYLGDDVANILAAIEHVRPAVERGSTRAELQILLPPGSEHAY